MVTIEVTQEDIDKGEKGICSSCPAAIATNKVLARGYFVEVGERWINFWSHEKGNVVYRENAPVCLTRFIWNFDNNKETVPFSFELDIPIDLLRDNPIGLEA